MQLKLDECDDGCMPTATAQRPEQLCIGLFGDTSMFALRRDDLERTDGIGNPAVLASEPAPSAPRVRARRR